MSTASRFTYTADENGCWIWGGYYDRNGYGRIYLSEQRRTEWAHRWSYEMHVGPIAPGYQIDHMCQVTSCVNPEHLQQLTRKEHMRVTMSRLGKDDTHAAAAHLRRLGATYAEIADALGYVGRTGARDAVQAAISKGLVAADEVPRVERLTDAERAEIADLVAFGVPQTVVAELYGIHSSQVSRVSRGITSGHRRAS